MATLSNRCRLDRPQAEQGARPSVEALLHVVCVLDGGATVVAHTHPTAVNALTCTAAWTSHLAGRLFPDDARERLFAVMSRNAAQAVTLLETIAEHGFDACIGGARRDEEKARAKERIFSFRDEFGQWDPKSQRPELWDLYNTRVHPGENMRVFPISNWTELDVWQYIAREKLELPPIYFAHERKVIPRNGLLVPLTDLTPPREGETVETQVVRFRTVGDISCTCPVSSDAATVEAIIAETAITQLQDVLSLPTSARLNLPGRAQDNWGWRVRAEALTDVIGFITPTQKFDLDDPQLLILQKSIREKRVIHIRYLPYQKDQVTERVALGEMYFLVVGEAALSRTVRHRQVLERALTAELNAQRNAVRQRGVFHEFTRQASTPRADSLRAGTISLSEAYRVRAD